MYVRLIVIALLSKLTACYVSQKGVVLPFYYISNEAFEEATKEIGPDGGEITLGAVVLKVPPRALSMPTRIVIKRYPADESNPESFSLRDRYTAEPFLLRVSGDRPFVLTWTLKVPSDEEEFSKEQFCPKVSWTADGEKTSCYATSGMVDGYSVIEDNAKENSSSEIIKIKKIYVYSDSIGTFGLQTNGCMSLSRKDIKPGEKVTFEFLTDRLGHFKILPKSSGDVFGGRLLKPLSQHDTPGGKCVYAPPSERYHVSLYKDGEIHSWKMSCNYHDHCENGYRCQHFCYKP